MHCRMYGTIPGQVFALPELDVLALDGNLFNGSLPATLSGASELTVLEVSVNRLTGEPGSTLLSNQPHRASHRAASHRRYCHACPSAGLLPSRQGSLTAFQGLRPAQVGLPQLEPTKSSKQAAGGRMDSLNPQTFMLLVQARCPPIGAICLRSSTLGLPPMPSQDPWSPAWTLQMRQAHSSSSSRLRPS